MELTGKVIAVLPAKSGVSAKSGKEWTSQEYVIEVPGQYPKHLCFTVFGEQRIQDFAIQQDETITVSFDIDASEYQGKWYNKITAFNVGRNIAAGVSAPQMARPAARPPLPKSPVPTTPPLFEEPIQETSDDLPF